uniref:Uncharacterized protein n=1 Tax=Panagrellus redivivus TaxID=6233 RepID=A0A7E4V374_PANRE
MFVKTLLVLVLLLLNINILSVESMKMPAQCFGDDDCGPFFVCNGRKCIRRHAHILGRLFSCERICVEPNFCRGDQCIKSRV